jgi:hypothetical protein
MDNLGQEHDILQRDMNREGDIRPLLSRIDAWEQESIDKIRKAAEQARIDLNELIDQKKQEHKTTMIRLTNELQSSRESEDYTELDLKKWIDQLNGLRQDLEQSIDTHLVEDKDQRSAIWLIKVKNPERSIETSIQNIRDNLYASSIDSERFDRADKGIELLEDGLVAMFSGPRLPRSGIIFGAYRYSTGNHRIDFQIEKMADNNFFIGIVTHSQTVASSVFSSNTTVNGWWRCNYSVVYGTATKGSAYSDILQGDKITLLIDCERKQIHLEHHRKKQPLQLSIDTQKCVFPWKLVVALSAGNGIRIVH